MTEPIQVAIAGAGRMGQAIAERVAAGNEYALAGIWERGKQLDPLIAAADVLIDFSLPEALDTVLASVLRQQRPLVCGVSGFDDAQQAAIAAAAERIPVVFDRNMSQGIAALHVALQSLARSLGDDYRVTIEETHHVHKKDAPSGTALALGETAVGAGVSGEIEYQSERFGEVPGDHRVTFRSATETVELGHSVTTRDVFADGALRAARWLAAGRAAGLYSMRDVLFL